MLRSLHFPQLNVFLSPLRLPKPLEQICLSIPCRTFTTMHHRAPTPVTIDQSDDWKDGAKVVEPPVQALLQPRAYQMEMFDHSMKGNIIATMETGSGKSLAAKLRIEAELQRTPDKLVWMITPSVALSKQQHVFLSTQLPAYSFRLITGLDNVQFWSSKSVWDAALLNINAVVSTPQVLLDALTHAFVSLSSVSLLVVDEAHHCVAKSAINTVMQQFYHSKRDQSSKFVLPNIMGLTASPIIKDKASTLEKLELNLNAICKAPTLHVEEYRSFVHLPQLIHLPFKIISSMESSLLSLLESVVRRYDICTDPAYMRLKEDQTLGGKQKFAKMIEQKATPISKQLKAFYNNAFEMSSSLGSWATDRYITACVEKLNRLAKQNQSWLFTLSRSENYHMNETLRPVRLWTLNHSHGNPKPIEVSPKVSVLSQYLKESYQEGVACIIFVQRRSTAYGLLTLLAAHEDMQKYHLFSFVGASNPLYSSLIDLADRELQDEAFVDFKNGHRNVCIATQVMEEGIDIQACSLVIRFDQPGTFRSFIQSRGRARRPNSKFVTLHPEEDALGKYANWKALEDDMKKEYADREHLIAEYEATEALKEECDRIFRIVSSGAVLTFDNARQHLQHFCATLPRRDRNQAPEPVYIMEGEVGQLRSCKIILPSSVSPLLQTTNSLQKWRTEKMAKKDAAFEVYKRLYHFGLVNEHLLPPTPPKVQIDSTIETRNSTYRISELYDPWEHIRSSSDGSRTLFAHRISIIGTDTAFPSLLLLLPIPLRYVHSTILTISSNSQLVASFELLGPRNVQNLAQCEQITSYLFHAVLSRKLIVSATDGFVFPYLLVPDHPDESLAQWFLAGQKITPFSDVVFNNNLAAQKYLVVRKGHSIPYLFTPCFDKAEILQVSTEDTIEALRLSRRVDYLTTSQQFRAPMVHTLDVGECSLLGLSAGYGEAMILMPSIMHNVEIALRAQTACDGRLQSIAYQNLSNVISALTAPAASLLNYQRLEYVGDMLLKFYTSVNVFCENPQLPESHLTIITDRIVTNARLQRATRDLGLDAFLTNTAFSAQNWPIEVKQDSRSNRELSSKVLADIIESLLGAAYFDSDDPADSERKILKALELFLPDVKWKSPKENITTFTTTLDDSAQNFKRLIAVEEMIGYRFNNPALLAEALTHSTLQAGIPSYERLEFLGDACIDRLVKIELYKSKLNFDEEAMSRRQYTLLNEHIFAFLNTKLFHYVDHYSIETDLKTRRPEFHTERQKKYLNDYVVRIIDANVAAQREAFLENYADVHDRISHALDRGNEYPWADLYHLDAPKAYSDIIESIIGACFVDSDADLSACRAILTKIGLMKIVDRYANTNSVTFSQPLERVRMLQPDMKVETRKTGTRKTATIRWESRIVLDGRVVGRSDASRMGCTCRAEAEARAAEDALRQGLTAKKRKRDGEEVVHDSEVEDEKDREEGEIEEELENKNKDRKQTSTIEDKEDANENEEDK